MNYFPAVFAMFFITGCSIYSGQTNSVENRPPIYIPPPKPTYDSAHCKSGDVSMRQIDCLANQGKGLNEDFEGIKVRIKDTLEDKMY